MNRTPPLLMIEVPLIPPSTNHLYQGMGKQRHRTPAYEAWLQCIIPVARLAANEVGWVHHEGQQYRLILWLQFATNHRVDVSNRIKAAEDGLAMALEFDDKLVVDPRALHCGVVKGKPRTLIALKAVDAQPQWGFVGERNYLKTRRPYTIS